MRELLIRTAAPAIVVVLEREGPPRLLSTAETTAEGEELARWVEDSDRRTEVVEAALRLRDDEGGRERGAAWAEELRRFPGGVVEAVEELLRERLSEP